MNERFEEDLVQAAFGDLTLEEAAEIERQAMQDPEAAKALTSYREMSEGLRSLREVPEHQLSTERLRHAILSQGLAPRRASWGFGRLLIPAGAVAMTVLGYMALNPSLRVQPQVVARPGIGNRIVIGSGGQVASDSKVFENDLMKQFADELSGRGSLAERSSLPTDEPALKRNSSPPARARSRTRYTGISVAATSYGPDPGPDGNIDGGGNPAMASADSAPQPQPDNSGIVVIESDSERATGANRATEVDSARNVVIGG